MRANTSTDLPNTSQVCLVVVLGLKIGTGWLTEFEAELPRGRSQAGAWERVKKVGTRQNWLGGD